MKKKGQRLMELPNCSNLNSGFTKPFHINVHTDDSEDNNNGGGGSNRGDVSNRGFCLDYVQLPCNVARGK